jgi:DNA-binding transcriptional ArsR family regulator
MNLLREDIAREYASWFRCLSDPTRLQILGLVAATGEPMTVGAIVTAVGKSQSTVSRHLHLLAEERFVFCEPDGVRTLVSVNQQCMTALPSAAADIIGVPT